ncbi:hypothetical protein N7470_000988 [Penicillium chermesinum]|nr:hypothetical protein N7470_000988 [Penicillium chermesinum]
MEAGTREERLQMRQRGAGTRKIKEVNFGFSFGGPALGLPDSNASATPTEPEERSEAAPTTTPNASQSEPTVATHSQRTPGSARNQLPARPSPYDVPLDDGPMRPWSNKRRKISMWNRTVPPDATTAAPEISPQDTILPDAQHLMPSPTEPLPVEPTIAGNTQGESEATPLSAHEQESGKGVPDNPGVTAPISIPDDALRGQTVPLNTVTDETQLPAEETGPSRKTKRKARPAAEMEHTTARSEQPRSKGRPRKSTSPAANKDQKAQKKQSSQNSANDSQEASIDAPMTLTERGNAPISTGEQETQRSNVKSKQTTKRKGKSGTNSREPPHVEEPAPEPELEPEQQEVRSKPISEAKRPRGRPSLSGKKGNVSEKSAQPTNPTNGVGFTREPSASNPRRGRKKAKISQLPDPLPGKSAEPEQEPASEAEPEAEVSAGLSESRHGRSNKNDQRPSEQEPESQPVPEPARGQRRGRPKKTKRPAEQGSPDAEEPTEAVARETNRKHREPRGETVPVTVHRLANVSALGSIYTSRGSGDEDEESADELSTRHKTRLPNRGGVNPADVLSQICRETLEKTLTTLKEGIANETNPTRRAEWTRKRKAVEAFGSELDGRLLDLSEMLDSNFVLGMQLKKGKRDMMDMRSHLYKIRREREHIALQMDAVREKHREEENAKTARSTINNSLHSLDLALDRSQNKTSSGSDPSFADLEFMLRSVADDVSSQGPGARGGLLNQIRAFNAQLEATARQLEG